MTKRTSISIFSLTMALGLLTWVLVAPTASTATDLGFGMEIESAGFGMGIEPAGFGIGIEPAGFGMGIEPAGFGIGIEPAGFGIGIEPAGAAASKIVQSGAQNLTLGLR